MRVGRQNVSDVSARELLLLARLDLEYCVLIASPHFRQRNKGGADLALQTGQGGGIRLGFACFAAHHRTGRSSGGRGDKCPGCICCGWPCGGEKSHPIGGRLAAGSGTGANCSYGAQLLIVCAWRLEVLPRALKGRPPHYAASVMQAEWLHSAARRVAPDIFKALPPDGPDGFPAFLPSHKPPCWKESGGGKLRCLPFVYILGINQARMAYFISSSAGRFLPSSEARLTLKHTPFTAALFVSPSSPPSTGWHYGSDRANRSPPPWGALKQFAEVKAPRLGRSTVMPARVPPRC